jgi:F-box protein 21
MALTDLPDEILRSICFFADWHDAIHLQATCHRFEAITAEPLLWKHHCRSTFTYWSHSHYFHSRLRDATFLDWRQLFRRRLDASFQTSRLLDGIIASQTARTPKLESIVAIGYDAKDVLDRWCGQ